MALVSALGEAVPHPAQDSALSADLLFLPACLLRRHAFIGAGPLVRAEAGELLGGGALEGSQ